MLHKVALFSLLALPSLSLAADPSGVWSGKLDMDLSKLSAADRKQAQAQLPKINFVLTFKKDKTYSSKVTGSPDGKTHTSSGTWNLKGNAMTLTIAVRDNKPAKDKSSQTFIMAKDGKSMTMTMSPNGKGMGGKAPTNAPTVKITLKKN